MSVAVVPCRPSAPIKYGACDRKKIHKRVVRPGAQTCDAPHTHTFGRRQNDEVSNTCANFPHVRPLPANVRVLICDAYALHIRRQASTQRKSHRRYSGCERCEKNMKLCWMRTEINMTNSVQRHKPDAAAARRCPRAIRRPLIWYAIYGEMLHCLMFSTVR